MLYWLGVAGFALTILISVSLHELGHMITAKRYGMKVTKYFVYSIVPLKSGPARRGVRRGTKPLRRGRASSRPSSQAAFTSSATCW